MEKQSDAIALSTDNKSLEETKVTIFDVEFKKFKKEFSLRIALLCLPFVLLFVAHLAFGGNIFQKISFEEMQDEVVGLDDLLLITSLVPLFILPLSFLHYKSRKTVYKAWLTFSGLGLLLFIWSLVIYMTMSQYDERRTAALSLLALSYVAGSVLIWLYGVLTKNIFDDKFKKFKKWILLGSFILSIPALSLLISTFFGVNLLKILPILRWLRGGSDLFDFSLLAPLVVLPFSLLHCTSRESIYKVWLAYSGLGLILFMCCVAIYNPRDFLAEVTFILLGLLYILGSVLIWFYGVVTGVKTSNSIFGANPRKVKKSISLLSTLLTVFGVSLYLNLHIPYWMSSIDSRTFHLNLRATTLGLDKDAFWIAVIALPATLTFFSFLYYKSRETIYKAWLAFSLSGLIMFTIVIFFDFEMAFISGLGGIYIIGSILIWFYGLLVRDSFDAEFLNFKKNVSLLCALLSIPFLSLYIPFFFFGIDLSKNLPIFNYFGSSSVLLIYGLTIPLIVLPLSLVHKISREAIYKAWLVYSMLSLVSFICCVVTFNPRYQNPEPFITLEIAYIVGSVLIWLYGVVTYFFRRKK